ncbi:hypothetical protein CRUP_010374 [Coryphaenoides rupestris]|nr:hypothetical protein CRUP_010374 [Coryphaenoides rupestris]
MAERSWTWSMTAIRRTTMTGCMTTSACPRPCTPSPMDPARPRDPAPRPTPPATDAAVTEVTPSSPEPSPQARPQPS